MSSGELFGGEVGRGRDVAGVMEGEFGVGAGFGEALIAVEVFVMGALGKELRGGEQGDRVGGLVLEGGAGHLEGFAGIIDLLIESHGLLEEEGTQFAAGELLCEINCRCFQHGGIGLRGGSLVRIVLRLCLGLGRLVCCRPRGSC